MPDLGSSMGLPFEEGPPGDRMDLTGYVCGGLVVMAAVLPVEDELKPALVFRFADALGQFHTPFVLVLDEDQARNLVPLVTQAVDAAIRTAREQQ